jgi:serine acetyltransferase
MNTENPNLPRVGVVVIGRDEGERLVRCLDSLAGPGATLVYVDSGSKDDSVAVARARGATVVELDPSIPFTAARARNAGIEALPLDGTLHYVQLVDGDCQIDPNWLTTARSFLESRPDVAGVGGQLAEQYPERSLYNRLCAIEWNTPIGEVRALGGIAMYRLADIRAVGCFNPDLLAGEEPELCLRLRQQGKKLMRLDAAMALHDADLTRFGAWWRRMRRGGYGSLDVVQRLTGRVPDAEIPFHHMVGSVGPWSTGWLTATLGLGLLGAAWGGWLGLGIGLATGMAVWVAQAVRIGWGVRHRAPHVATAILYGLFTLIGKWAQRAGHRQRRREWQAAGGPPVPSDFQQDRARYPESAFVREQSLWAIAVYRFGRRNDLRGPGFKKKMYDRIYWLLFRVVETLTGVSFTKAAVIGPGLRIHHFGNIFIHSNVVIGTHCVLRQGVTIGNRTEGGPVPVLGDRVECGAYAQILGGITIGDDARIGAMSVVLQDVPPGHTAIGIPAKIIPRQAPPPTNDTPP